MVTGNTADIGEFCITYLVSKLHINGIFCSPEKTGLYSRMVEVENVTKQVLLVQWEGEIFI